jgi:peroxiredoxin
VKGARPKIQERDMSRAAVVFFVASILSIASNAVAAPPICDDPPPEATFVDASGKSVQLADYRGKQSLVLLFMRGFTGEFACYQCSLQMRAYQSAYAKLKAAGAEVVAVLPGAKDATGFVAKVGEVLADPAEPNFTAPFPVLLDPDFSGCRTFGVSFDPRPEAVPFPVSEPATVVLAKDGRVVWSYHGTSPPDRPTVDAILDVLTHGAPANGVEPRKHAAAPPAPVSTLPWKSYAEGMALAKAQGQPVLLDFHALW